MTANSVSATNRAKIEQAISALENQRALLGDEVVDTAISSLRQELQDALPAASSQRKQVSVLFADLVEFTALTAAMDVEEVLELVNALWERLDQAILRHGGTIDKHVGDSVMALFGAPVAQEDDPERAVLAGLAMQAALRDWVNSQASPALSNEFSPNLQMRIGINTGLVLFGAVGSTGEITAMGDTVNIASRLESAAPAGGVLIAEETWRQVAGRFDAAPLSIRVKGREDALTAFVVKGEKSAALRTSGRGVAGIETRTVGREVESERLRSLFAQVVEERQAKVVTVLGEAGIGKSRLLQEFSTWLSEQPQAGFILSARASAETERQPYLLVRECIASKLQITNSTPAPLARERLITGLADIEGDDPGMAEFIGQLIGLDFSGSPRIQNVLGDAQQIRSRSFQYLARFFSAICREQPAIVLLDDIHWADSGSLDVIEYLGRECSHVPLLIVCLARPSLLERRSNWGSDLSVSTVVPLQPLSPEQSRLLVGEILRHVQEIPANLVRTITEAAGGNAFHIEELVKVLIEDGVIVPDAGAWRVQAERLGEVRVPPTLTAVLQARIDRLPPRERELLQRAAVVGKVFWNNVLQYIGTLGQTERDVDSVRQDEAALLAELVRREFIQPSRESAFEGAVEYQFRHAILHEVAYESVLLRRRRPYHQRVAEWLLQVGQDRVAESAGLIGEHFARAGHTADATHWFAKAGHRARETYLPEVAIDYYVKALGNQRESETPELAAQHRSLYYYLGEMLFWQARYDEAVTAFQAADKLAEQSGDVYARSQAWNQLSRIRGRQGNHRQAIECAEQAAAFAEMVASDQALIQAFLSKIRSLMRTGKTDEALALGQHSLQRSVAAGLVTEIAEVNNLLGLVYDVRCDYSQSIQYKEQALELFHKLGDRRHSGWVLHNLGLTVLLQGNYPAAIRMCRDALQIAQEIGDRDWEMAVLVNMGVAYLGTREFAEAATALSRALEMTQGHDFYGLSLIYASMAETLLGLGRTEEAYRSAIQSLELAERDDAQEFLGYAWRVIGQIVGRTGLLVRLGAGKDQMSKEWNARACFERSLEVLGGIGAEPEQARTLREWALYERESGNEAMFRNCWDKARVTFERLRLEPEIRRMDALLAAHTNTNYKQAAPVQTA